MTLCKQDMAVMRQDRLGLSPFGLLSRLFQEELEQRVRQETGGYAPIPLTLLEEEEPEEAAQPLEVQVNLDVHVDAPKAPADKRPAEKAAPKQDRRPAPEKPAAKPDRQPAADLRILERVRLRERELREKQEVIHRLEVRLDGRRWDLPPAARQGETLRAAQPAAQPGAAARRQAQGAESRPRRMAFEPAPGTAAGGAAVSAGGRAISASALAARAASGTAVTRGAAAHRPLELVSRAASSPSAGGWLPQTRPARPGYPGQGQTQNAPAGPDSGSILLPDVLRRRREEALAHPDAPDGQDVPADVREMPPVWLQAVRQAVEETIEHNHSRIRAARTGDSGQSAPQGGQDARVAPQEGQTGRLTPDGQSGALTPAQPAAAAQTTQNRETAPEPLVYREAEERPAGQQPAPGPGRPEPPAEQPVQNQPRGTAQSAQAAPVEQTAQTAAEAPAAQTVPPAQAGKAAREGRPAQAAQAADAPAVTAAGEVPAGKAAEMLTARPAQSTDAAIPPQAGEALTYREAPAEPPQPGQPAAQPQAGQTAQALPRDAAQTAAKAAKTPETAKQTQQTRAAQTGRSDPVSQTAQNAQAAQPAQNQSRGTAQGAQSAPSAPATGEVPTGEAAETLTARPAQSTDAAIPPQAGETLTYREAPAEPLQPGQPAAKPQAGQTAQALPRDAAQTAAQAAQTQAVENAAGGDAPTEAPTDAPTARPAQTALPDAPAETLIYAEPPAELSAQAAEGGAALPGMFRAAEAARRMEQAAACLTETLTHRDAAETAQAARQAAMRGPAQQTSRAQTAQAGTLPQMQQAQAIQTAARTMAQQVQAAQAAAAPLVQAAQAAAMPREMPGPDLAEVVHRAPTETAQATQTGTLPQMRQAQAMQTVARTMAQQVQTAQAAAHSSAQGTLPVQSRQPGGPDAPERAGAPGGPGMAELPLVLHQTGQEAASAAPAPWEGTAGVRDIRMIRPAAQRRAPAPMDGAAGRETAALTYAGAAAEHSPAAAMGQTQTSAAAVKQAQTPAAAAAADRAPRAQAGQTGWEAGQPDLILARGAQGANAGQAAPGAHSAQRPTARGSGNFAEDLPPWAKEMLERAGGSAAKPGAPQKQMEWTAPWARGGSTAPAGAQPAAPAQPAMRQPANAAALPAEMQHKQRAETDEQDPRRKMEREAELRRTADRVYRMIEERLRRELRRSGR